VTPEQRDQSVRLELLVQQVLQVQRVTPVQREQLVHKVRKVFRELKVTPAIQVQLAQLALPDLKVLKEHKVNKVFKELKVTPVQQEQLVQQVHKVMQEFPIQSGQQFQAQSLLLELMEIHHQMFSLLLTQMETTLLKS
jgi:hypothetical protein